jgi:hypothetical protein
MVLPDFLEIQFDCSLKVSIDYCVGGNEVCSFSNTVDDYHDHIIAMCLRKFNVMYLDICGYVRGPISLSPG